MLFWTIPSSVAIPPLKIDNLAADYRAFSRVVASGYARRDSGNAVPAAAVLLLEPPSRLLAPAVIILAILETKTIVRGNPQFLNRVQSL
jgi:hypothetical protein